MGRAVDYFAAQGFALPLQHKTKMLALDREFEELETQVESLKAENLKMRAAVEPLKREVERLEGQLKKGGSGASADNPAGYNCDQCGSQNLKRIGNRPHLIMRDLGNQGGHFSLQRVPEGKCVHSGMKLKPDK